MTPFQYAVLGLFIVFLIGGVAAFALYQGANGSQLPQITIWGTIPDQVMVSFAQSDAMKAAKIQYKYVEENPATLESDFVEALASGNAPDLVLLPADLIYRESNKILPIPYESIPERTFRDTFVDSASIMLSPDGVLGLPMFVDPLVMYYNRDMLSSKGIAKAPQYWDEFLTLAPKFNERNAAGNLSRTIIALGETINVTNFKEVLSALILQAGNPITRFGFNNRLESVLDQQLQYKTRPAEAAIRFYTQFSNPVNPSYSWNKSFLDSRDAFIAADLAVYFGFSSELPAIRSRNPNLNFDVTRMPQIRDAEFQATFGRVYALVVPKNAKNPSVAFTAAIAMVSSASLLDLGKFIDIPPARRDILGQAPANDPYKTVFYSSAVSSRSWLDPSPEDSRETFAEMINSLISGEARAEAVLSRADQELESQIESNAQ